MAMGVTLSDPGLVGLGGVRSPVRLRVMCGFGDGDVPLPSGCIRGRALVPLCLALWRSLSMLGYVPAVKTMLTCGAHTSLPAAASRAARDMADA
jgi:hypothetical protein